MQVNSATSAPQVNANSTLQSTRTSANAMNADDFMQILLAQMTHQNPLEPMDNAEMTTQFSQLNSLQQLREINGGMEKLAASNQVIYLASLIGKSVKVNRPDGKVIEGVVEEVFPEKDNPQLRIGTEKVSLDDVIEVKAEDVVEGELA
jgi:flagellar basal-body rod modification protein FlgD